MAHGECFWRTVRCAFIPILPNVTGFRSNLIWLSRFLNRWPGQSPTHTRPVPPSIRPQLFNCHVAQFCSVVSICRECLKSVNFICNQATVCTTLLLYYCTNVFIFRNLILVVGNGAAGTPSALAILGTRWHWANLFSLVKSATSQHWAHVFRGGISRNRIVLHVVRCEWLELHDKHS